jgi:hypothetical protein
MASNMGFRKMPRDTTPGKPIPSDPSPGRVSKSSKINGCSLKDRGPGAKALGNKKRNQGLVA